MPNPKIEPALLKLDGYLLKTFQFISNNTKIVCLTCKSSLASMYSNGKVPEEKCSFKKRWLTYHMCSKSHIEFESDKQGLHKALQLFGKGLDLLQEEEKEEISKDNELKNFGKIKN